MSYLNRRLRDLEQRQRQSAGPCATCGGFGDRGKLIICYDDDQPDLTPCALCGREPYVIHVFMTAHRPDYLNEPEK